jgi:hypothetical protein
MYFFIFCNYLVYAFDFYSENGNTAVANILQGRFVYTDKLFDDDDRNFSRRPSRLSKETVSSWPQAVVMNDGRCTPMIESLIKMRFSNEGNNPLQRPFRHPQALDEHGVPMIESSIKGRWYCPNFDYVIQPKAPKTQDWIARNKVNAISILTNPNFTVMYSIELGLCSRVT